MADLVIVYWRDIPAQIIVRLRRQAARRELPPHFAEAIDAAAMRSRTVDSAAYLDEWRKAEPVQVSDDLEAEADAAMARLDADYPRDRLARLVQSGGHETGAHHDLKAAGPKTT